MCSSGRHRPIRRGGGSDVRRGDGRSAPKTGQRPRRRGGAGPVNRSARLRRRRARVLVHLHARHPASRDTCGSRSNATRSERRRHVVIPALLRAGEHCVSLERAPACRRPGADGLGHREPDVDHTRKGRMAPAAEPPRPFVGRMFYYVRHAPAVSCLSVKEATPPGGGSRSRGERAGPWVGRARFGTDRRDLRRAPQGARSR
jgi:hypothetical protein